MNKKQGILFGIALVLLFTGIALATSNNLSASSDVVIYAFDQNPAGSDEGNEWVTLYNPSNESMDIGNWVLETTHGSIVRETIPEGTMLNSGAYYIYSPPYQWLDNEDESIILKNSKGKEVDRTPTLSDKKDDNYCWVHKDSKWVFEVKEEFRKPTPKPEKFFNIKIEEDIGEDHFKIKATDASHLRPLPDVTVAIYEHGIERLLSGPKMTDETGCAIIEVPKGYNKYFDIVAEYKGERRTLTVDRRSRLIKLGDKLGPAGIAVFAALVASFIGFLGWLLRHPFENSRQEQKKKKGK